MKTNTIDPKYYHGAGAGWMEQESDTPRTDAASKAEVERLRSQLQRAVEIAESSVGLAELDYENDKFGKVSELKQELAALKKEIK